MKQALKTTYFLFAFPFYSLLGLLRSKFSSEISVTILLLHDIPPERTATLARLFKILKYFGSFITPCEFEGFIDGTCKLEGQSFLVTFDDGFRSSKNFTQKVLEPLEIKAVFFVCPSFIGSDGDVANRFIAQHLFEGNYLPNEGGSSRTPMNLEELLELQRNGHLIGSHTTDHTKLSSIGNEQELYAQIAGSRAWLEKHLGKKVEWFAYPFGDIHSISRQALETIGKTYKFNFSGLRGQVSHKTPKVALWRQSLTVSDSLIYILFTCLHGFDRFYKSKRSMYLSLVE